MDTELRKTTTLNTMIMTIARPMLSFYSLLLCVLALLMLIYEMSFMDRCKCKFRKMLATSKLFLFLVMMHQGIRLSLNFIPMQFYNMLMNSGSWGLAAQNILDLTPEILFILTYSVILFSWIEFFIYLFQIGRLQRKISNFKNEKIPPTKIDEKKPFKIPNILNLPFFGVAILGVIMFLIVFAESLAIAIFPQFCGSYTFLIRIQGITIAAASMTFSGAFLFLYFILMMAFCPFRRFFWGISETSSLRGTLFVITVTGSLYFIFLVIRVIWVLVLDDLLKGWATANVMPEWIFHVAWILYMLTESIPMTLMLFLSYIFRTILGPKSSKWKSCLKDCCFRYPCCSICYACCYGSKYDQIIKSNPEDFLVSSATDNSANSKKEDNFEEYNNNDTDNPKYNNSEYENSLFEHENENGNENEIENDKTEKDDDSMVSSTNTQEKDDSRIEFLKNIYIDNIQLHEAEKMLENEKKK